MSAAPSGPAAPQGEDADDAAERAAEATFLDSLPGRLRRVTARERLTRDCLPRRGESIDEPQLSAAAQRVWDAEKNTARCLAEQYRALAELHEHEGEYEEIAEFDEVGTLRAGLALRVTRSAASWQLRDAYQAVHLFPRALERMGEGIMPSAWFLRMLKTSRDLTDASRRDLDLAISTWSMDITPERFFTLLKALIQHLQERENRPDPVASLERAVELLPGQQAGTGVLQITGPIPEILAQWKTLDESARAVQSAQRAALRDGTPIPHDPDGTVQETGRALPLARLRYLLMDSADLDLDGVGVPAERFRLNITVPVLTLLGASDEPGTLDGVTPLPPSLARSLAGAADVWHRVLTAPNSGAFLPLPADRYAPTPAMLQHLRLRNAQCAVPGCTRPSSWASECDHIEECLRGHHGKGGLTEIENLHLLCWQHHLDKTNGLLDPTRITTSALEPGRTRWKVGGHGDEITVIDDLDAASIRMAEDLADAWTCFLRGTRAGTAVPSPAPSEDERPGTVILTELSGPRTPATPPRRRIIPLDEHRQPPGAAAPQPAPQPPAPPQTPPGHTSPDDTPPDSTGLPPGDWGQLGPPPF